MPIRELLDPSPDELSDLKLALDTHAVVAIADADGRIVYANGRWCAISKYSREELLGQQHRIVNPDYHTKEFIDHLWETIGEGRIWRGELKNKARNGSFYWMELTIVPLRDAKEKPRKYVAIGTDTTVLKNAEDVIRRGPAPKPLRRRQKALLDLLILSAAVVAFGGIALGTNWTEAAADFVFSQRGRWDEVMFTAMFVALGAGCLAVRRWHDAHTEIVNRQQAEGALRLLHDELDSLVTRRTAELAAANAALREEIGEREQAEASLRLSESKFARAFENNPAAIAITRLEDGVMLAVNDTWVALCGFTREEVVGHSARSMWVDQEAARRFVRELREHGVVRGWEQSFRKKSGEIFVAELWTQTLAIEGEKVILSTLLDITTRKRAEDERHESERRLREMLENVELIAVMVDKSGAVIFCNDHLLRLTGWQREEVIGADWFERFTPQAERELRQQFFAMIEAGQVPAHTENPIRTRSGEWREIVWNTTTLRDSGGRIIGTASIGEDVTEQRRSEKALRESEERFRQVVETIHEVFWMVDATTGKLLYVSPGYERIWGRSIQDLHASREAWMESVHPEDRARVRTAAEVNQVKGTYDETYRIVRPDEVIRWIRDVAFTIKDATGAVQRIVGIAEDISERKQLEEQFLRAQRLEAVGTLSGGIAHDLNNILAPMRLAVPMLMENASEADRRILGMIERGAQRGAAIIQQLLTFSRGVEGMRGRVQLEQVIRETVEMMRETFPREIEIVISLEGRLWPLLADATQLQQVVLNLCVNARDAMPAGGKLTLSARNTTVEPLEVAAFPQAKPGKHVTLSVADTGSGIPRENISRIFEPFFTTKELGKGTGLGLSTVLGIVKSHRGFVTVESEVGHGTIFKICLPADESEAGAAAGEEKAPPRGEQELVLVVDDEPAISAATRWVLEKHGYRVLTAANGQQAIEAFLEQADDVKLLLTDLMMPGMNGVDLIRTMRAIDPRIRVIATSGLQDGGRREELATLGVTEVLAKPCRPAELLHAVWQRLHAKE